MRRTSAIMKAQRMLANNPHTLGNGFPATHPFVKGTKLIIVPLTKPVFKEKEDFFMESNPKVFIEVHAAHIGWLDTFTSDVVDSLKNSNSVFQDSKRDLSAPGICAIRIYEKDNTYAQIQVTELNVSGGNFYQLDYYENRYRNRFTLISDISDPELVVTEIAFGEISNKNVIYANKVSTLFKECLIYLRPWEYSVKGKNCTITPFPICFK